MSNATIIYATSARVGRTVSQLIGWQRLTQKALAEHLDLPPSSVSDAIAGRRRWTVDELERTADFLNVDITDLVSKDGPDPARLLQLQASRCTGAQSGQSVPSGRDYAQVVELRPLRRRALGLADAA